MRDLSYFKQFVKQPKTSTQLIRNQNVITYTRVSSSGQKDNFSLPQQIEAARKFAMEHNYNIVDEYGNTYESASGDITRKEFMRLIDKIKSSRKRPFGILVWVISRFSRTGGNGISLANELVEKLGVHIIEVSTGLDTTTDEGKINIYQKLLDARKENIDRMKHTIPGMQTFVKSGQCLGVAPLGYTLYGHRVKDPKRMALSQRIEINEDGKKLKIAWEHKASGVHDYIILNELKLMGLEISKQKMSTIWRNPFYAGIQCNALTEGDPVQGKWPPLVSLDLFYKVQKVVRDQYPGHNADHEVVLRPLTGTLYCFKCGRKMTSYLNKKKNLHYYKCRICKGASINAVTSKKFKNHTGVHELFIGELDRFNLAPEYIAPFSLQIKKMVDVLGQSSQKVDAIYKKRLTELEAQRDKLKKRKVFGDITQEEYDEYAPPIEAEIRVLNEKYQMPEIDSSNFDSKLEKAIDFTQNISKHWQSGTPEIRQHIQKLVFPEGLVVDTKNRIVLTSKVNLLFAEKAVFAGVSGGGKQKLPTINSEESGLVAGGGLG